MSLQNSCELLNDTDFIHEFDFFGGKEIAYDQATVKMRKGSEDSNE